MSAQSRLCAGAPQRGRVDVTGLPLALTLPVAGASVGQSMTLLRGAIRRVGIVWLLCQAATLTMAPAILWLGSSVELLECTCAHGDHAICPMHHKAAPGSKLCVGSAQTGGAAAVTSLFGGVGPVPTRAVAAPPAPRRVIAIPDATTASLRPAPPDPPPPRA